jgi:hypothetical protein
LAPTSTETEYPSLALPSSAGSNRRKASKRLCAESRLLAFTVMWLGLVGFLEQDSDDVVRRRDYGVNNSPRATLDFHLEPFFWSYRTDEVFSPEIARPVLISTLPDVSAHLGLG